MTEHSLPVIVSIATLPSRIGHLRPTLDSLMDGDLVPDKILVLRSNFSERENSGYIVPDFLNDQKYCRGIVQLIITDDWGPGTKVLGAVDHLKEDCYLVLADDDVIYHPKFLYDIVGAQASNPDRSFSYYTFRVGGLTCGQGCDGFSFYSPNLEGIKHFAEKNVVGTSLLYHDDLWISFFLYKKGIKVRAVSTPVAGETVYSQVLPNEGLSSITSGDLSRDNIVKDNFPRLLRQSDLSKRSRAFLFMIQFYDVVYHYVSKSVIRLHRMISKYKSKQAV